MGLNALAIATAVHVLEDVVGRGEVGDNAKGAALGR